MPQTIGYHLVKTTYGMWLPGDERGSWSARWDEQIGFIEPHMLHPGDPTRQRMAGERLVHSPVRLAPDMIVAVIDALNQCTTRAGDDLRIEAAAIEPTHVHLLLRYSLRDIDRTAQWLADQTTKSVHRATTHQGPVWCKGKWRVFIFEESHWQNTVDYIQSHNIRRGDPARPYPFLA